MEFGEIKSLASSSQCRCADILCCFLGLRELETRIYWVLSKKETGVSELSEIIGRDRTTIQRAVQNLIKTGLVTRRSLPVLRGKKFIYAGISSKQLRKLLYERLDEYYFSLKKKIKTIKED